MKLLPQIVLIFIFIGCCIIPSFGQSKIDTITLKKGEVFDILLLSQKPKTEVNLKSYFQVAIPVAKKMSYQPLASFKIVNNHQGNLQPELLILGKWRDIEVREDFLTEILKEVPDFHERRRKIWSYFGLQYFEIKEYLSFEVYREQYQVATAYWLRSEKQISNFYKNWEKEVQKSGGKILISLMDGKSPFGYRYDPDCFVITSWESKVAFDAFQEKIKHRTLDDIQHINEFILN